MAGTDRQLDYEHDYETAERQRSNGAERGWGEPSRRAEGREFRVRFTYGSLGELALPMILRTQIPRPGAEHAFGPHPSFLHGQKNAPCSNGAERRWGEPSRRAEGREFRVRFTYGSLGELALPRSGVQWVGRDCQARRSVKYQH